MMPTPTGLPKVGEVWERTFSQPPAEPVVTRFVVLERTAGDYWARGTVSGLSWSHSDFSRTYAA
jgi:hypothetical protein